MYLRLCRLLTLPREPCVSGHELDLQQVSQGVICEIKTKAGRGTLRTRVRVIGLFRKMLLEARGPNFIRNIKCTCGAWDC